MHISYYGDLSKMLFLILYSERSDECIDFTVIITSRNNAAISNLGGGFRWKSEYLWCIIEIKNKHCQGQCYLFTFKFLRKRENLQRNDDDLCSKDFKYFTSRRYLKISPILNGVMNVLTLKLCVFFCVCHHVLEHPVFDRKVNLVDTLGGQNVRKNPKKVTEKQEFLRKTNH
ncbi:Uncharacterized protein FWK35_00022312 [Aphis craccivora]|uniref:Uncharacterized protein n=1 Tax=Aphis craccivora TaxID=307492 RepID=A0A6G0YSZ2_APHCR|nr:Uncharacterized protein FWK35_00022312 [Aphis craccivora]